MTSSSPPAAPPESNLTAWHVILTQFLQGRFDPELLTMWPFVKLGTLPLEADVLLFRKQADLDLAALYPDVDFLLQDMPSYLVVEYKSPDDALEAHDMDKGRAYLFLCKLKHQILLDKDIGLTYLASHIRPGFWRAAEQAGIDWYPREKGIWQSRTSLVSYKVVQLSELSEELPHKVGHFFSSRHREFVEYAQAHMPEDPYLAGLFRKVIQLLSNKEFRSMLNKMRGSQELVEDVNAWKKDLLASMTPEDWQAVPWRKDLIASMTPEELVDSLTPDRRKKLVTKLTPEELLQGLDAQQLDALKKILSRAE